MSNLTKAITIAAAVHENQVDKAGAHYILHPLRLMMRMNTDETRIVAVLHDVLEDCSESDPWSTARLYDMGFDDGIVKAVECLTKKTGENYDLFIERISENSVARLVKIADLEDNMNLLRLNSFEKADLERLARYHRSWKLLTA